MAARLRLDARGVGSTSDLRSATPRRPATEGEIKAMGKLPSLRRGLWEAATRWLPSVPEVPPAIDACECFCREPRCTRANWERCDKRLARMAERLDYERRAQPDNVT
jgi:hypothetical protein